VAADLERRGYVGRTIGVKLRYDNFRIVTRDNTLAQAVNDTASIRKAAFAALLRVAPGRKLLRPIRLIGVRVGSLRRVGEDDPAAGIGVGQSLDLFGTP
jgi:DNA polymerase-4